MSRTGKYAWAAALLLTALAGQVQADTGQPGLRSSGAELLWPRWQGRVLLGTVTPLWRQFGWESVDGAYGAQRVESLSVLGDYYFSSQPANTRFNGGFRATSGLIFGAASHRSLSAFGQSVARAQAAAVGPALGIEPAIPGTLPYLGLGYTRVSVRNGWGFSADIGLVARNPGSAVKLGALVGGAQSLDDLLRDMRLSPLLNLGVSYSF